MNNPSLYQKHSNTATIDGTFDYNTMLAELKERFGRHIRFLGARNTKGSKRYELETDFMYALNDLEQGPQYLRGKLFDKPNNVINRVIAYVKTQEAPAANAPQVAARA
jgi:hypothetical protein